METLAQERIHLDTNNNRPRLTSSTVYDYISPSRLKLWLKCPLAFKLRYIDGIVTPTTPNLFLGQVVHRGLEYFYRHRQRGVNLYTEVVCEYIDNMWDDQVEEKAFQFKTSEEEVTLKKQAGDLVTAYLDHLPDDEPAPIAVEERFEAPLIDPTGEDLGIPLVGIIDLVVDETEGPVIADFKTAARSSSKLNIIHELQLSCYSYLFRDVTGQTEEALEIRSLIKTKTPKVETERYGPRREAHFDRLFSVIRAYLDAINGNKFHIRPGLECSFCDYQQTVCRS